MASSNEDFITGTSKPVPRDMNEVEETSKIKKDQEAVNPRGLKGQGKGSGSHSPVRSGLWEMGLQTGAQLAREGQMPHCFVFLALQSPSGTSYSPNQEASRQPVEFCSGQEGKALSEMGLEVRGVGE